MNDFWPHKFTPFGREVQIGEEDLFNHTKRPIMAQPMVCVHCHVEFTKGLQPMPNGPCPARSTKQEKKRLLG